MPILVDNEKGDRQPMPLLKRANLTTEMVRTQSTVGKVRERRARNAVLRNSNAGERRAHQADSHFARDRDVMLTISQSNRSSTSCVLFHSIVVGVKVAVTPKARSSTPEPPRHA